MSAASSKEIDPVADEEAINEVLEGDEESAEEEEHGAATGDTGEAARAKKKKSKKAKLKKIIGAAGKEGGADAGEGSSKPASKLTTQGIQELLKMNPSLKAEMAGMDQQKAVEALRNLDVGDLMTGMTISGKNQKDMASYKFWQTQPVTRFDDKKEVQDGPIKEIDPDKVPKEPRPLYEGFDWVTMDLENEQELTEVHQLLSGHYVEDAEATFRLTYTASFLNWALKSPGWRKDWHLGVRASKSKKLVAFISGVPVDVRIRDKTVRCSEVNFMVVHKKLRSKRLAPVLIEEITRRCYLLGIYQAVYTGGTVLPTPVTTCRYFHRPLDWQKLFDVGFSGMPPGSTKQRQIAKNFVPASTALPGFRPMESKDVKAVHNLLCRYLKRFEMAPEFTEEETTHWFINDEKQSPDQVIWTYVVEDTKTGKITDFTSFYLLESAVIGNSKHETVKAAYSFYYASETAFEKDEKMFKERLNALILDTLVMAKKANFDVFNALTLLDNPLYLEQQKFGPGDGQLHYYLYNYRAKMINGGVDAKNKVDASKRGGMGMVFF